MKLNKSRLTKIALFLLTIFTTIFVLGCSTKGKEDDENVLYEFCPGKSFYSASQSNNMLYYATNQSTIVSSAVCDTTDTVISGSGFLSPVNVADDNGGMWVADGFCEDYESKRFSVGTYTLKFNLSSGSHSAVKYMDWENFPTWKSTPTFTTSSANSLRVIYVATSGINTDANTANYSIRYRIKVYVKRTNASQLFGQSSGQAVGSLVYSLPKTTNSLILVPYLVCEMSQNGRIEKTLFYKGPEFTYNP